MTKAELLEVIKEKEQQLANVRMWWHSDQSVIATLREQVKHLESQVYGGITK